MNTNNIEYKTKFTPPKGMVSTTVEDAVHEIYKLVRQHSELLTPVRFNGGSKDDFKKFLIDATARNPFGILVVNNPDQIIGETKPLIGSFFTDNMGLSTFILKSTESNKGWSGHVNREYHECTMYNNLCDKISILD